MIVTELLQIDLHDYLHYQRRSGDMVNEVFSFATLLFRQMAMALKYLKVCILYTTKHSNVLREKFQIQYILYLISL